jgi:hypothetical protein
MNTNAWLTYMEKRVLGSTLRIIRAVVQQAYLKA